MHNFYRSSAPSGENDAVLAQINELVSEGFTVETFFVKSDWLIPLRGMGGILASFAYLTGMLTFFPLLFRVIRFKPHIVHIHNLFPLISPLVLLWLPRLVRTFYTLHNYRNFCAAGVPLRNGRHCDLCLVGSQFNSLRHRCYRKSFKATLPIYLMNILTQRLNLLDKCSKIIVLNNFKKDFLVSRGVSEKKIIIKGNNFKPIEPIEPIESHGLNSKDYMFIGRLTEEKGIENLLYYWDKADMKDKLHVYGSGLLEKKLKEDFQSESIIFHGFAEIDDILIHMRDVKGILVTSLCIEGYPMVISYAQLLGVPLIVTDIGPLPEISGWNKLVIPYEDFLTKSDNTILFFKTLSEEIEHLHKPSAPTHSAFTLSYKDIYANN